MFSAYEAECDHANAVACRDRSRARNQADVFARQLNGSSGNRNWSVYFQSCKHPVHRASGSDALYDLLADVASFVEVQCAILCGLLRQRTFPYVDADSWNPTENAEGLERGVMDLPGACLQQRMPNPVCLVLRYPQFKIRDARVVAANHRKKSHAVPGRIQ